MSADQHRILLAHGGGGRPSEELIRELILPRIGRQPSDQLYDSAAVELPCGTVLLTTDSYVVRPLFFPGGDIGRLAVCGTMNDLVVSGAIPVAMAVSLIIEEGLEVSVLERVLESIGSAAAENGVQIVTGDTKTVEAGAADGLFVNTTGLGIRREGVTLGFDSIRTGDLVLLSGTIGDHGMTILAQRNDIGFQTSLTSDCASLAGLVDLMLTAAPTGIRFMRDPTRGGLAATLCEIATGCGKSIEVSEDQIPVNPTVKAAAEMLGLDVLEVANEGKVVVVVDPASVDRCLRACQSHHLGRQGAIIGRIKGSAQVPIVELITHAGGKRMVQMPYGSQLPRIC